MSHGIGETLALVWVSQRDLLIRMRLVSKRCAGRLQG